jgi:hypothetical protein
MNQNIKPLTAINVVLAAVILISLIFWARQESLRVGGPDQVKLDHAGSIFIHISDKLYKLSPALNLLGVYDLAELGIYEMVGDFAFFASGDMLVRLGKYEPGLLESIARYQRKADTKAPVADRDNEGLFRCKLDLKECSPFGAKRLDFDSAFHLSIDTNTDTVYLSDTGRHKLRKFDAEGNELVVQNNGYKFPNQNLLHNNKLLVADTNHHAIQVADTSTENFGKIVDTHSILDPALGRNTWPYSFAKVGDQWWVNNMAASMSHGTVAIYNDEWEFIKTVELPENADPIDFAVLKDRVLITDLDNIRIYLSDFQGQIVNEPLPGEITLKLTQLNKDRQDYKKLGYGAVGLFIAFLMAGFIIAIRQARTQEEPAVSQASESLSININDPNIKWIEVNKQKLRIIKFATFIPLLLLPVIPFMLFEKDSEMALMPIVLTILIIALAPLFTRKLLTLGIGTLGDVLVIKKSGKEYAAGKGESIYYSDTHILIDKVFVPFNGQQMLFNTEQVVKDIMPLLRDATYVQSGQMMNMMLKRQKLTSIFLIFLIVVVVVALILGEAYQ